MIVKRDHVMMVIVVRVELQRLGNLLLNHKNSVTDGSQERSIRLPISFADGECEAGHSYALVTASLLPVRIETTFDSTWTKPPSIA